MVETDPESGKGGSESDEELSLAEALKNPALQDLLVRLPALKPLAGDLVHAYLEIVDCFSDGGILFLCGNGGSMADALHMSAELLKSYTRARRLPETFRARLVEQRDGELLARNLQSGLRTVVLGINPSLTSAVANDMPDSGMILAQELVALGRSGDVLLCLSTSGEARNVLYAAQTAHAMRMRVIALTGGDGGRLASLADVAICVPASRTDRIQECHEACYHTLCEMLEMAFFG